jgi:WD40 repeat protein
MNQRRRDDRYIGVVHADAFLCSPAVSEASCEPQYHRQLREALEVPCSGVLQYRDYTQQSIDEDDTRSRSPDSLTEVTPGMGFPASPEQSGARGEECSTPRNQGLSSPFTSPQKALWTPVRDGGGCRQAAHRTPRPPSQHTTPVLNRTRKDCIQALRILDADGISSDAETQVVCWGSRSALIVGIRDAAYRWDGGVECLLDAHCGVSYVAASSDDELVDDGYAAVGLENGLVHVFRFDRTGIQKPFGPPIGETLSKVTALHVQDGMLFIGDVSGVFAMHSLVHRQAVFRTALASSVRRIVATADGNHIAVGLQDSLLVFHRSSMHSPIVVQAATTQSFEREHPLECIGVGDSLSNPTCAVAWLERPEMLSTLVYGTAGGYVVVQSLGSGVVGSIDMGCKVLTIVTSRTSDEFAVSLGAALSVDHYHDSGCVFVVQLRRNNAGFAQLRRVVKLEGHSAPVLHMALSPQGDQLATAAGQPDDTLRMWAAFPPAVPVHRVTNAFDDELR